MSVLLEFSIVPLDKGESIGADVARVLEVVDQSGVDYRFGPMGTCLEGEWDEVMGVVKRCLDLLGKDSHRIAISMKMDYRQGPKGRLAAKVESVEKRLGRPLRK